jgi:hypothetical protein
MAYHLPVGRSLDGPPPLVQPKANKKTKKPKKKKSKVYLSAATAAYALPNDGNASEDEPIAFSQPRDGGFTDSESETESDSESGDYIGTFMHSPDLLLTNLTP